MPKGPEHKFATAFIDLWKLYTKGWAYRIPDSYHVDAKTKKRFSHSRPADWIVSCKHYTALVEFKFLPTAKTFSPLSHLRNSQTETIECLDFDGLRYYLVLGNGDGAWAWQCSEAWLRYLGEEGERLDLSVTRCVGWYPYANLVYTPDQQAMLK